MRSQAVAERYAEALYDLAVEQDCVDKIEADYERTLQDIEGMPDVFRFLTHPLVPRDRKMAFLEEAFPDIATYLHNLFSLLVHNHREGYLDMIYKRFVALRTEKEGIVQVQVVTAHALSQEDRQRLSERLEKGLQQRVRLEESVDADLLGGVRIEVDGKVLDGTLRARLNNLKTVLAGQGG